MPATDEWETLVEQIKQADSPSEELYEFGVDQDYGLGGAIEQGVSFRRPEDVDGQATCYEQAVQNYQIAKDAGLEPRFFETVTRSPEMVHGLIDVEEDGERIVVDPFQDLYGPIEGYGDVSISLEDGRGKTTNEINGIIELSEEDIEERVTALRNDPETMLEDGQRLYEHRFDGFKVYDAIKYDTVSRTIDRYINFADTENHTHLNHTIRIERDLDGLSEPSVSFADISGSIWRNFEDEYPITEQGDEVALGDLSRHVKQQISAVMGYKEARGDDDIIYDEERLETFWKQFEQDHEIFMWGSTPMNSHINDRFTDYLSTTGDDFWQAVDWLCYLSTDAPEHDDIVELRVERYLDQNHRHVLDEVMEQTGPLGEQAGKMIRSQTDRTEDISLPDRLSGTYDDLSPATIETYEPLLFVDQEVREQIYQDATDPDRRRTLRALPNEDPDHHELFADAEVDWRFDTDTRRLVRTETLGGDTFNIFTNQLILEYDLDPAGRVNETRVAFETTTELADTSHTLFESQIDDLDNLDLDTVMDGFEERKEGLMDRGSLSAPQPETDSDLIEDNWRSIALYAGPKDESDALFDQEQLENFVQVAINEFEQAAEFEYHTHAEQQRIDQSLDVLEEVQEIEEDEFYEVAEQNLVTAHIGDDDDDMIQRRVEEQLDQDEQARAYLWGFYDTLTAIGDNEREKRKKMAQEGMRQASPGPDEIDALAEEMGYERLKRLNDAIESLGYSWEQKAEIIRESGDVLSDIDGLEQEQVLWSFATRIADRDRYQTYEKETGDDLIAVMEQQAVSEEPIEPFEELELEAI